MFGEHEHTQASACDCHLFLFINFQEVEVLLYTTRTAVLPEGPAKGTCVASAVPLNPGPISTKGTRASCAIPIGHGSSSAKGSRADSAVRRGKNELGVTEVTTRTARPMDAIQSQALPADV